jgi:tight adherence protein C
MVWAFLSFLLIGLAVVLFMLSRQAARDPETEKRFNEALDPDQEEPWLNQRAWRRANSISARFKRYLEKTPGADMQEVETLIRQSGLTQDESRALIYASLWMTPVVITALAILIAASQGKSAVQFAILGFGVGMVAPRKVLRWLAERRQKLVREELPIVLNLMRLLFDAGLSLEHTLKAISEQGKQITPEIAGEFGWVLQRIHHGQDRGAALEEMAQRVGVAELTETVAILKQAARYGGSLRESLLRYLRLMEDRRLTDLRDKVGKLSAKMTMVMVAFMFPALMIFLAGPGFMAIAKALTNNP